jgi:parallel beta-helix repeat protein
MLRRSILILCLLLLIFSSACILYLRSVGVFEPKPPVSYDVHNISTGIGYATIQEALDAPETKDGQTISVERGIFHEHLVARKAVFLVGENRQNTILDGDGNGTIVSAQANVTVDGFTIQNGSIGIAVNSSSNGRITDNIIRYDEEGVCLLNSSNWTLSANVMTDNSDSSLILNDSDRNVIERNSISYAHLPLHEAVDLYNSSHNNISENSLTNNQATGIQLNDYSFYNTVSNNFLMNNSGGIQLVRSCNYNLISQNSIIVNETTWGLTSGIWIRESQYNMVYANEITSDRSSAIYRLPYEDGIGLSESTNNSIVSNKISLMDTGVGFHFSSNNNSIINNSLTENGHGIDFSEGASNGNNIYSNDFMQNAEQVHNVLSANTWDGGYPSGGNYWSDYETKYPNATEVDSSGIWNTAYVIDSSNIDRYPLKSPFVVLGSSSFLIFAPFMIIILMGNRTFRRKQLDSIYCSKLEIPQFGRYHRYDPSFKLYDDPTLLVGHSDGGRIIGASQTRACNSPSHLTMQSRWNGRLWRS